MSPSTFPTSAPLWRRFAALVYDTFLLGAISMAYGAVVTAIGAAFGAEQTQDYSPMFEAGGCLLYTSPSPRDDISSRMPSSA